MNQRAQTDDETVSLFLSSAEKFQALAANLDAEQLDTPCEDGGWTVRQVVHHVTDDCDVWSMCIKKAIATPGVLVRFEGFPGNEAWARGLDFAGRPVEPALDLLAAHRRYLAEIVRHFPNSWDCAFRLANAQGEVMREFNVREMLVMLTDHMQEHVEMVERLLNGATVQN